DFFRLLGVVPAEGRVFTDEEHRSPRALLAVVSQRFWRAQIGRDFSGTPETIHVNGRPCLVIGVMPANFRFPDTADIWIPLFPNPSESPRTVGFLEVLGRLKPGMTLARAKQQTAITVAHLLEANPRPGEKMDWALLPVRDDLIPGHMQT